ncbi:hypothetical protein RRF57_013189 [Xylaria bambusicola]|uniref:Uncharacterized protein n=1 Tax=Xylaria bambusicola TaxID=326684 RepID=A0AAN7V6B6_9PEZI
MKPQGWMRMRGLADGASAAAEGASFTFKPQAAEKSFFDGGMISTTGALEAILVGHQCPVYFCTHRGEEPIGAITIAFSGHTEKWP